MNASSSPAHQRSVAVLAVLALLIGSTRLASAAETDTKTVPPVAPTATATSTSLTGTVIHLYYLVIGYTDQLATPTQTNLCSASRTQLRVGADDGTTLTVAIDKVNADAVRSETGSAGSACTSDKFVQQGHQYTILKKYVLNASPTIQGFVTGALAIPFKFHLSDRSVTAGSTIGTYIGYRTSIDNTVAITPVVAGGLALISTAAAQASSSGTTTSTSGGTQTSTGISIATGLIGSVTSASASGAQFGILVGADWLGKKSNYAYEGKPWIAFEIGYNFAL
jgi:hypothetical protein